MGIRLVCETRRWLPLLVLVASVGSPAALAPTAIRIQPDAARYQPSAEGDFAAIVTGGPFAEGMVRWTVEPRELGVVDARGHFRAGPRSGTGSLTASLGSLAATAKITVACPATRTIRDISFNVRCTEAADVYTEARMSEADSAAVSALVDEDVAAIERDLGRRFATQALVYAFADPHSYETGVRRILGERAAMDAAQAAGFFAPWVDAIALDWEDTSSEIPITLLRHELTHRMVWQIVGSPAPLRFDGLEKERSPVVPAWLDEGLATVEEETVTGAGWMVEQDRVFAAAMYRVGGMALKDLVDLKKWNDRSGAKASYQYMLAAQAVRFLSADLGKDGIVRILERVKGGATFADAYRSASGFAFTSFANQFGQRIRAGTPTASGLVAAPYGEQSILLVYGFTPRATVTISFAGPASLMIFERVDEYGNTAVMLGSAYPAGSYAVTAAVVGGQGKTYTITK